MYYIPSHGIRMYFKMNSGFLLKRMLHTNTQPLLNSVKEVEIKVPGWQIKGKLWGPEDKQPILALHGWQDNAGSFDALAPILSENTPILTIDLPGHGLSSWLPTGMMYDNIMYILLIKRIQNYFGWDKIKIMGHSFGGFLSFYYASLLPKDMEYVILLDVPLLSIPISRTKYNKYFSENISKFIEMDEFTSKPKYTETEIITRLMAGMKNSLNEASCRMLMKRGATKEENGTYTFNRDPRIKYLPLLSQFITEDIQMSAECMTSPCLLISATKSHLYNEADVSKCVNLMKDNKTVYWEKVEGLHHVHMMDPKAVANIIFSFLQKYNK
ncbi:probable serine hydrolase [Hylaeus anthracinus]|uniref:probable serine hydrolase n=1 Tax=Hylaeus anthracinus TaxID=313031 RepID=UPI0023B9190C|nr:probable serine hydrolase [Hylaeus anthracinus]